MELAIERDEMIEKTEKRWAIYQNGGDHKFLCGRFYFYPHGNYDDPDVKTFRTRKTAREAKKQYQLGRTHKVVPIIVTVKFDGEE